MENVKTELDGFLGPTETPTTWMKNSRFSRTMTTEVFHCCKMCYNGRVWFQLIQAIEERAARCSGKFQKRAKFVFYTDTTTPIISLGDWRCGSSKQEDMCDYAAVQGGQAREFICWCPNIRQKERRRYISTSCLWERKTWWICISTRCNKLILGENVPHQSFCNVFQKSFLRQYILPRIFFSNQNE